MTRVWSAGLLVVRQRAAGPQFLLVHPGGPYWRRRDKGAWSIPKGAVDDGEDGLAAARREFTEETGLAPPSGPYVRLGDLLQRGGKLVSCWLVEGELDLAGFRSNVVELKWPPRSRKTIAVPECDDARFLPLDEARRKILTGQRGFLEEATGRLGAGRGADP